MADIDRRYQYGNNFDGRYEKEYWYGNGIGIEDYCSINGKGVGNKNRADYGGSYESENRNDHYHGTYGNGVGNKNRNDSCAVVPYNHGVYRTYELRTPYGSGEPRKLEVVKGNVFSANQIFVTPPPEMSYRPPLPLPVPKEEAKAGSAWCFSDPEMKRKRRVASYKAYTVEGKVKASLRKGYMWIKYKCSELIHGW